MSLNGNSETSEVYFSVIDRTFDVLRKDPELASVRRDVLDRIKRQWIHLLDLDPNRVKSVAKSGSSDPSSVVNRSKYMNLPSAVVVPAEPELVDESQVPVEDDEYADEFEDSEFVSATISPIPAIPVVVSNAKVIAPVPARRVTIESKKELVNVEELGEDLEDPEYDAIPEVSDCAVRVFGQTEVCESTVGSRRADSRWMVTVLNGFVKDENNNEFLFRTAKQTMGHLHHHS